MTLDITDIYDPSFLRSPYAEIRESLNALIHAAGWNRCTNQSTHLGAPENRNKRTKQAPDTAHSTRRSYDQLTAAT